jgi:hypothetical protein
VALLTPLLRAHLPAAAFPAQKGRCFRRDCKFVHDETAPVEVCENCAQQLQAAVDGAAAAEALAVAAAAAAAASGGSSTLVLQLLALAASAG